MFISVSCDELDVVDALKTLSELFISFILITNRCSNVILNMGPSLI